MRAIYRFFQSYGRHGDIEGKFVAPQEDVARAIGCKVHFYEPWGKHSYADAILSADQFTVVSSDPADVDTFVRLNAASGENPIAYLLDNNPDFVKVQP